MTEWLDILLKSVGSAAGAAVVTYSSILFAKLKNKIKESRITAYIKECVKAAEQLYPNEGTKMGPQKYNYVVQCVLAKFPYLTNNEYLKSLIEGAVYTVSQQVKQIVKEKENASKPSLTSF